MNSSIQNILPKAFSGLQSGQSLLSGQENRHLTVICPSALFLLLSPRLVDYIPIRLLWAELPTLQSWLRCDSPGKFLRETPGGSLSGSSGSSPPSFRT